MSQEQLKPCPFCGGRAEFNEHTPECYFSKIADVKKSPKGDVACMLDLIPAWNTRATQPEQAKCSEVDELVSLLAACRDIAARLAPGVADDLLMQAVGGPSEVPAYIEGVISELTHPAPAASAEREARVIEQNARKAAQEQLYAERERHTAEVKRLQAEIGRLQAPAASVQANGGDRVFLVATGEVYEGQETYTRHDIRPPLCDAEVLYTHPAPTASVSDEVTWEQIANAADAAGYDVENDCTKRDISTRELFTGFARAILALRPAQAGVPEGWKLVPVEPTPEMKSAGINVEVYSEVSDSIGALTWAEVDAIYRAMLAAAPAQKGGE